MFVIVFISLLLVLIRIECITEVIMILTFQSILNLTDLYPDAPNSLSNCAGVVVQKCHGNQRKNETNIIILC